MLKRLLQLTLILIILFLAKEANAGIVIRPVHHFGLVGYWDFQEGQGTIANDHSGNSNHGTLTNMDENDWVDGQIGTALEFDGSDDKVDCGSDSSIDNIFTSGGSISAWIYPTGWGLNNYGRIVHKAVDTDGSGGYGFMVDNDYGNVRTLRFERGHASQGGWWEGPTDAISLNSWQHVAVTYNEDNNDNNPSIYINGVSVSINEAQTPNGSASTDANQDMLIGNFQTYTRTFDGLIDEVRVYNRALSAGEVGRLYNLSKTKVGKADKTGLVGYWPFEEGSGTKVGDHSREGNNGDWNGTGAHWAQGRYGMGGVFNGSDDYVDCYDSNLDITGDKMTIAAWVYMTGGDARRTIATKWGGYFFEIMNTRIAAVYLYGTAAPGWHYSTDTVSSSTWIHVAFTYDGSKVKYYFNAVKDSDEDSTSGNIVQQYDTNVYIGGIDAAHDDRDFQGLIDEVRIYNRALSASEVEALYQATRGKFHSSKKGLTNGLVGMWSFDGPHMSDNTAIDISGQGNNGTLTNGPKRTIGRIGQALEFDGVDDYVDAPYSSDFDVTTELTITAWVKPASTPVGVDFIFHRRENNNQSPNWGNLYDLCYRDNNKFQFCSFNGTNRGCAVTDNTYSLNNWYFVAGVFNGSNEYIYVNGVDDDSTPGTVSGSIPSSNYGITIGYELVGASNFFDGLIDEVRVYNRALSADEVKRLYNMGR